MSFIDLIDIHEAGDDTYHAPTFMVYLGNLPILKVVKSKKGKYHFDTTFDEPSFSTVDEIKSYIIKEVYKGVDRYYEFSIGDRVRHIFHTDTDVEKLGNNINGTIVRRYYAGCQAHPAPMDGYDVDFDNAGVRSIWGFELARIDGEIKN